MFQPKRQHLTDELLDAVDAVQPEDAAYHQVSNKAVAAFCYTVSVVPCI